MWTHLERDQISPATESSTQCSDRDAGKTQMLISMSVTSGSSKWMMRSLRIKRRRRIARSAMLLAQGKGGQYPDSACHSSVANMIRASLSIVDGNQTTKTALASTRTKSSATNTKSSATRAKPSTTRAKSSTTPASEAREPTASKKSKQTNKTQQGSENDDLGGDDDEDSDSALAFRPAKKSRTSTQAKKSRSGPAKKSRHTAPSKTGKFIGVYDKKNAAHERHVQEAAARREALPAGPCVAIDEWIGRTAVLLPKKAAKAAALEADGLPPVPAMKRSGGQPIQHGFYEGYFNESKAKIAARKMAKQAAGQDASAVSAAEAGRTGNEGGRLVMRVAGLVTRVIEQIEGHSLHMVLV